jgi:predicted amidophosphoribosyltransferase
VQKNIKDKKVLLIDDVWTTDATLKECSAILKRNKAKIIWE